MKRLLLAFLLSIFATGFIKAQEDWIVPEDAQGKLSDFEFNEASVETGQNLFMINCRSCHGIPGQNNYLRLNPPPGDPATDKIQHNSDGALYHKIREGKGQMPSFRKVLSVEQVWDVVSYLRSFNPDYVQQVAVKAANNRWANISISLNLVPEDKKIRAEVTGLEGDSRTPVAGAEVRMDAERTFGHLQLGEVLMTNEQGMVFFDMPADLPGDREGNLNLIIQLDNEEEFGTVKIDTVLQAGMPFTPVSLRAKRAMWNTMRMAPIWLLITYTLGVLTVWGFIFFVLMKLRVIFKLGEKNETNNS